MKKNSKYIYIALLIVAIAFGIYAYINYKKIYATNVSQKAYLYIKTGSEYKDVVNSITEQHLLNDVSTFEWLAAKKEYPSKLKPEIGRAHV